MSTTDTSGQPSTGTVTATPAAAPAPASSSTVQDDFKSKIKTAPNTPLALRSLIDEMKAATPKPGAKATAPAPAAQEPAPAPVEATPEAQPAEVAPPEGGEETPATEVTEPAATEDQPAEPEETEDNGDGPVTPVQGKRAHLRLAEDDQVGRLAASLMKRNRDMPMAEAVERAQKQLGITPQKASEQATEPEPTGPKMPQTVEETQQTIAQKLVDYKKAMAEVRFEDAADLQAELLTLTGHRSTLERQAEQAKVNEAKAYDEGFAASHAKATDLYPFAADPTSPGGKRMLEIDATLKANDDPLYYSPDRPLKIAQMVAAEMNIAPKKKGQPAPVAPAAPAQAAPKKGIVPSGSSRTVPPAPKPAVDPEISNIKTMADLRKQLSKVGVRV